MQDEKGNHVKTVRLRLVPRGFMEWAVFDVETFSGTARGSSQSLLGGEAACHPDWALARIDIDKAALKGPTCKELADATGEKGEDNGFYITPGSASALRSLPGCARFEGSKRCHQCLKPGTGTKDAPRAFSLKLRTTTQNIGLVCTQFGREFELGSNLLAAQRVDDVNMTGLESSIDACVEQVEKTFGTCKLNKRTYANCVVRYSKDEHGSVQMDQDDYLKQLRPIARSELTGAPAEAKAAKTVTDTVVSLRGALVYALLAQAWPMVYAVSLQRAQEPTNRQIRRLNAITRKANQDPKRIAFPQMEPGGEIDMHSGSDYRKRTSDEGDFAKVCCIRGANLPRRGRATGGWGGGDRRHTYVISCEKHSTGAL